MDGVNELVRNQRWGPCPAGAIGAGEGNRTLVCSLGSCRSAIELRPRNQRVSWIFRLDHVHSCGTMSRGDHSSRWASGSRARAKLEGDLPAYRLVEQVQQMIETNPRLI